MIRVRPIGDFECEINPPETEGTYEISQEDINLLCNKLKKWHQKENGEYEVINNATEEEFKLYNDNCLRGDRAPLLHAWDILLGNVSFGAETVTEEERQELIAWKHKILDLDEEAINNPPAKIRRYLK